MRLWLSKWSYKMRIVATAAMALVIGNAPAFAKDGQPYLEVDIGALLLDDVGFDTVTVKSLLRTDVQSDLGYDAAAIVGYDLGPVRLELEGSAKRAGIDALFRTKTNRATNASVTRNLDGSGNTAALSIMANALVDIGADGGLQAFAGGGIGYAWIDMKANADTNFLDDTDGSFAWQALAGVRYPVSDKIDLGLKYRFFNANNVDVVLASGTEANPKWRSHSLMATLAYNLGGGDSAPNVSVPMGNAIPYAPLPAAPATPPKAPPVQVCNTGPYLVFFDWDNATLSDKAQQSLDAAASQYAWCGNARVLLSGHADRSGAAAYNVPLSQRRNAAVRSYLTTRGIADEAIASEAFGESNPRVATQDGVREPQNRRVEVTYGPGSGN
jgi:OOP family OmpA-OmpF porin